MLDNLDKYMYGLDLLGEPIRPAKSGPLAERFGFPPFTVFDTRSGDWQDRKRDWISLGIKSECGREDELIYAKQSKLFHYYRMKEGVSKKTTEQGTSIFDPVLCEVMYRWFVAEGGQVIDPFAGGSVRGVVASFMSRRYWGSDLRSEQIAANKLQGEELLKGFNPEYRPTWISGDSRETLVGAPEADFIFTCPPYGNLERYSDDPRDLSTMEYPDFIKAYRLIISESCSRLKENRFAGIVVGDFRDSKGLLRNFVSDTIQAFIDSGLSFYNEAILLLTYGTAPFRAPRNFDIGRKLVKVHQNVLIFVKGDWRTAAREAIGETISAGEEVLSDGNE